MSKFGWSPVIVLAVAFASGALGYALGDHNATIGYIADAEKRARKDEARAKKVADDGEQQIRDLQARFNKKPITEDNRHKVLDILDVLESQRASGNITEAQYYQAIAGLGAEWDLSGLTPDPLPGPGNTF